MLTLWASLEELKYEDGSNTIMIGWMKLKQTQMNSMVKPLRKYSKQTSVDPL